MTIKIAMAQINPTIGDLAGNLKIIKSSIENAIKSGAEIIAFPELALTGYHPMDLLDDPSFALAISESVKELVSFSFKKDIKIIVGAPMPSGNKLKRWYNSALVIADGKIEYQYNKQLLPTYDVFDEGRHFLSGSANQEPWRLRGRTIGIIICEDGWDLDGSQYGESPFAQMWKEGADLVISINSSPSALEKMGKRQDLFSEASKLGFPIVWVNQVGGNDQIVFDGGSSVYEGGRLVQRLPFFKESIDYVRLDARNKIVGSNHISAIPEKNSLYADQIALGLRDYARRCGFTKVVVGSSGGIDSALTLALATKALGSENVMAITMPSKYSSSGSVSDSVALCKNLGVTLLEHPIKEIVDQYLVGFERSTGDSPSPLAIENLQARIRGTILMEYSNTHGHLLLTTGNKSEVSVGYCTLYGDTNGGLSLIGDLYKTEVFDLCRHINEVEGREVIPLSIIEKEPSAELAPDQKDSDSLPPYPVLDAYLKLKIEGSALSMIELEASKRVMAGMEENERQKMMERVDSLIHRSEYKRRQSPPIIKLRPRSFGAGRQVPIAAKISYPEQKPTQKRIKP